MWIVLSINNSRYQCWQVSVLIWSIELSISYFSPKSDNITYVEMSYVLKHNSLCKWNQNLDLNRWPNSNALVKRRLKGESVYVIFFHIRKVDLTNYCEDAARTLRVRILRGHEEDTARMQGRWEDDARGHFCCVRATLDVYPWS